MFNKKGKNRNKAKLRLNLDGLEPDLQGADDEEREVDWDNNSSTLNDDEVEEIHHHWNDADARKAAKNERKLAKHQIRFDVISKEDLDRIQMALHPAEIKDLGDEAAQASFNGQGLMDNRYVF